VCFFENVEGHISLGLPDVIEDLAGMGYRTTWGLFSAAEVGAAHQRKRVFILAYRNGERGQLPDWWRVTAEQVPVRDGEAWRTQWPSCPGEQQYWWEPPRVVAERQRRESTGGGGEEELGDADHGRLAPSLDAGSGAEADRGGQGDVEQAESGQTEPPLGRDADGSASGMDHAELYTTSDNRTDELRLLGNGVVPATAALAFRTLARKLLTSPG